LQLYAQLYYSTKIQKFLHFNNFLINYLKQHVFLNNFILAQSHSPDCSEKPLVKKTYFFLVGQSELGSSCRTLEKKVFEQKLVANLPAGRQEAGIASKKKSTSFRKCFQYLF